MQMMPKNQNNLSNTIHFFCIGKTVLKALQEILFSWFEDYELINRSYIYMETFGNY